MLLIYTRIAYLTTVTDIVIHFVIIIVMVSTRKKFIRNCEDSLPGDTCKRSYDSSLIIIVVFFIIAFFLSVSINFFF